LRDALAPAKDPTPSVLARVTSAAAFDPALLTGDLAGPGTAPRVLVLSDVGRLTAAQQEAVGHFLEAGAGVLVTLGDRADGAYYTRELFRGGGTNLIELPAFAPLVHELVYYLAGARSAEANVAAGQPVRWRLPPDAPRDGWAVEPPDGPTRPVELKDGQVVFAETHDPGVYK